MKATGLTLVEILVAMTVLAVGAAGLVGLQLVTLRLAAATSANSRLLHAAESELQQRLLGVPGGEECTALPPHELEGMNCSVRVQGCHTTLAGFECSTAYVGWPRQVTVTASLGDDEHQVTLSSVTRRVVGP